jgi:cell division protein FtsA
MAKPYIITGLDIGTGSIKMLSVSKKSADDDFEIVGFAQAPALGIRRGVVVDVPKVSTIISSLASKISEDSGFPIDSVYANLGGSHIFCTPSNGLVSVSRADQKISEEDIDRVLKAAQAISLSSNKEVIEVLPKEFIVDGGSSVKDALGMEGVRLEAEALVLCGFGPYLKNSSLTVQGSGLVVNDIIFSSLASAKAVLTPREKELGVCILDIGAGTTDMAVFEEGGLIHTAVFPVGSGHITNDIAICLKTNIDTAERIKIEFGSCSFSLKKGKEKKIKVDFKEEFGDEGSVLFSKRELSNIIEARVGEIFDLVNRELKSISKQGMLPAGIILTGGGAKLPGIKEMAKKQLKLPCRIGTSKISYNFQEDPSLSVLCGLVLEGIEMEKENIAPIGRGIMSKFKKMFRVIIP